MWCCCLLVGPGSVWLGKVWYGYFNIKMKLNLGCGENKIESWINVDWNKSISPDILMDVSNLKEYKQFKDNSIDKIFASHILEHLSNPFEVMKELHRILKPNGKLTILVPHFSRGFTHPEHKAGFDVSFPLYFNPGFTKSGYMGFEFKLEKMKLTWFAQKELKKQTLSKTQYYSGLIAGKIIDFFANLNPYLCSRIWCYWVGGFDQIEYVFRKKVK